MDIIADVLGGDAFNSVSLTMAINEYPLQYGRIQQLGVFKDQEEGIATRQVAVERYEGTLILVPTQTPGGPATQSKAGKRDLRTFSAFHIPLEDTIMPEELQGVRAFGSANVLQGVEDVIARKLEIAARKQSITREWLQMGALKGAILDADGTTLLDIFSAFGVSQYTETFNFSTVGEDIRGHCTAVRRQIEDSLLGELYSYIHCLCSATFIDKLLRHDQVKEALKYQESAMLRDDVAKRFEFGGILFEEYRARSPRLDGTTAQFITADNAHFFPMGTADVFGAWNAPADFNEAVNTLGLPIYAKVRPKDMDRGFKLHTQQNPLFLCTKPGALVKGVGN